MYVYSIKIESEEDGFHLLIDGDDPTGEYQFSEFDFRIADPVALLEEVKRTIGEWWAEGQDAARGYVRVTEEDLEAYEPNDPKRVELQRVIDRGGWA
jgi:hypothetical protein